MFLSCYFIYVQRDVEIGQTIAETGRAEGEEKGGYLHSPSFCLLACHKGQPTHTITQLRYTITHMNSSEWFQDCSLGSSSMYQEL